MKYIYGILLFVWAVVEVITDFNSGLLGTGFILTALCLFIIKERFLDNVAAACIYAGIIAVFAHGSHNLFVLLGIALVDTAYFKKYYLLGIAAFAAILLCIRHGVPQYSFHIAAGALWGYTVRKNRDREKTQQTLLDNERGLRYRLERNETELVRLQNEIQQAAEVRERDRIAREIHDNVGHSIAGVLFQLRAAEKIVSSNGEKVEEILKLCTDKLAEALETTRNTVYNIKSSQPAGIENIHKIINEFKFCRINFLHSGDFDSVSVLNFKIMENNTKELLTNAIKHSNASEITLEIDIKSKYIRCLYKDNGNGCSRVKESVGLSGIRDRVKNLGGTYSADGSSGFTVVYTLPNTQEIGVE